MESIVLTKQNLWRSTPPAIFPVSLGFMGLALAWRNASGILPIPHEVGDLMLGVSTAFFLFFAISFVVKIIARPAVVLEDLKVPPARAGVAAFPMAIMLLAAALLPLGVQVPLVWWTGVGVYYIATGLVAWSILKGPPEARMFSPFQYLAFVGPIVGPIAGIPLGYVTASFWLAIAAMIPYIAITLGYGYKLTKARPPAPLRPSLVIVLAPTSLFALAFGQLEIEWAFTLFYWMAVALAVVMLFFAMWLTKGGFTPIWGSFTFPIATFINLNIYAVGKGMGVVASTGMIAGFLIGTPLILYVIWKASQMWIKGDLAKKTGAAVA
jgi:tellurite resistance protein